MYFLKLRAPKPPQDALSSGKAGKPAPTFNAFRFDYYLFIIDSHPPSCRFKAHGIRSGQTSGLAPDTQKLTRSQLSFSGISFLDKESADRIAQK